MSAESQFTSKIPESISAIIRRASVCVTFVLTAGLLVPSPVSAGTLQGQWLSSFASLTSSGAYIWTPPTSAPYLNKLFFVQNGKATYVKTSRDSLSRSWWAKAYGTVFSGAGGMQAWGSYVMPGMAGEANGWPSAGSGSAVWILQGATSKRISFSASSAGVYAPIGMSAGHAYWIESPSFNAPESFLMHASATQGPAVIPNNAGLAAWGSYSVANAYDAGNGTVLVPDGNGAEGCAQRLTVLNPAGANRAPECAPVNPWWQGFISFAGRVIGPSGLVYSNGVVNRWVPTDTSGHELSVLNQPVTAGSEVFFFAKRGEGMPAELYAWNGVTSRLVSQLGFDPLNLQSLPMAFIGNRPYILTVPLCSVNCEKNRVVEIYDLGSNPPVRVATGTMGWANYYDIPSYPYCVACMPRVGFTSFKGQLYFSKLGSSGVEIYRWNPKTRKTTLFKNVRAGSKSSFPDGFAVIGSWMYFFADSNGKKGPELWATNGTALKKLLEGQ
jgi:ELWxxDGT repeat protein